MKTKKSSKNSKFFNKVLVIRFIKEKDVLMLKSIKNDKEYLEQNIYKYSDFPPQITIEDNF
jgi:hypothetical protein